MNKSILFNPLRFYLMVRNTIWLKRWKILLISATVGTLVVLICGIAASQRTGMILHKVLYPFFLFGSGFIVTARAFQELDDAKAAGTWLMIPASTFEKFTSRLFLTSVGYVAGSMLVYFMVTVISKGLNQMIFEFSQPLFNPLDPWVRYNAALYLVLQSMFLVGAIYFRRFAYVKTILFLSLLSLVFLIGFFVMSKWILGDNIRALLSGEYLISWELLSMQWAGQIRDALLFWMRIGFWGVLAPLCYVITYFRLKEIEA
jgi:hypothetical protein